MIITVVYLVMWKVGNRKGEDRERQRRQILAEKTDTKNRTVFENVKGGNSNGSVTPGY